MEYLSLASAHFLSDAVNPFLVLCWLAVLVEVWRKDGTQARAFGLASGAAVVVTYFAVHGFRALRLWPAHPWFPSGHETFAVSIVASLVLRDRRWIALTPLLLLLAAALVRAGYHDWLDIGGAALLTPPIAYLCHRLIQGRTERKLPSTG